MLEAYLTQPTGTDWTNASLVLVNGGAIRDTLPPGMRHSHPVVDTVSRQATLLSGRRHWDQVGDTVTTYRTHCDQVLHTVPR